MRKEYDFSEAERGPAVPVPQGKTRITIRLDEDILEWFKHQVHAAGGGNYQSLINTALREYIDRRREPLEETLRRVIREELRAG
ncbi:MAG TPA: BrnA antitoxin family protein [Thermoanaerobaculia bacterium]|nr:BrnA antitoxin family protein [Thermoanaerobaculia bacterium]